MGYFLDSSRFKEAVVALVCFIAHYQRKKKDGLIRSEDIKKKMSTVYLTLY